MNSSHDSVSQQWKGYPLTAHSRNVILLIIIQENIRGFLFKLCYVINYTAVQLVVMRGAVAVFHTVTRIQTDMDPLPSFPQGSYGYQ